MAIKIEYTTGSIVNLRIAFTDPTLDDEPTDPTTVTLTLRDPSKNVQTFTYGEDEEIVRESKGNYLYLLTLEEEGTYRWEWAGSSPSKSVVVPGACDSKRDHDLE